jgi:subtilisin family serine protease
MLSMVEAVRRTSGMRIRTIALLFTLAALGVDAQGPGSPDLVSRALAERVDSGQTASIIVGLDAPIVPEGDLASPASIARQRDAVRVAVEAAASRAELAGIAVGRRFQRLPFFTARVDAAQLAALAVMPNVASIQEDLPDRILLAQSVPLVGAPAAWAAGSTGAGWTVAVLDTGIDSAHPFLAGKVTSEACFSNAGGTGGGTSLCPGGAPTATGPGTGLHCDPSITGCEHGTHVAGIIAGSNGTGGMSGVAPGASLASIQVFTRGDDAAVCGSDRPIPCIVSYPSDQAAALDHVLDLAGPDNVNRIAAANLSLGGGRFTDYMGCVAHNPSRAAGIANLRSIGVASVGATGNDGYTNAIAAPACLTSIAVPSTTKADQVSTFSNRGATPIAGPGEGIVSSVPGGLYAARSGTSMAAAHISGTIAILKQAVPSATVQQLFVSMSTTALYIPDPLTGGSQGRVRVADARVRLLQGVDVPGTPGRPVAVVSGGSVTVSWTQGSGAAPTNYIIEAGTYPGATNIGSFSVGAATSVTASPGAGVYYIRVRASNNTGMSDPSGEASFSIGSATSPPGTPETLAATVTGDSVTLSWSPPRWGGPPTHYLLQAGLSPGDYSLASINVGNVTSFTATPPPGIYYVRVLAVNAAGTSTYASATEFALGNTGRPGQPGTPSAAVAGNVVTVNWTAPTTGSPPTHYLILAGPSSGSTSYGIFNVGQTTTVTASPGGGLYFIRIVGVNASGAGLPSAEISFSVGGSGSGTTDGTWNGQTSAGQSVAMVVSGGRITEVLVGLSVGACVRHWRDQGLSVGIAGGSFTRNSPAQPLKDGYTLSGTFSSGSASGTLSYQMTAGSCGGPGAVAWTATNSGVGMPILPLPPTALNAAPGPSSANLYWLRPDTAGGEWTGYDVEIGTSPGASNIAVLATTETSATARNLASGTYYARVRARNRSGTGRPSSEVTFNVSTAAPSYNGTWSGTTSQGKPFSFVITNNFVTSVTFGFTVTGTGGCTLDDATTHTPNTPVDGNQMLIGRLVDPPTFAGSGTFGTSTTATGYVYVTTALSSPCVGSTGFTWTAVKQ